MSIALRALWKASRVAEMANSRPFSVCLEESKTASEPILNPSCQFSGKKPILDKSSSAVDVCCRRAVTNSLAEIKAKSEERPANSTEFFPTDLMKKLIRLLNV
jgi:hypothetical protein